MERLLHITFVIEAMRLANMEMNMTAKEQKLLDDKMRAEIAKLMAETAKLNSENRWYPLIVGSSATLAIVAIVKLFL